MGTRTRDLVRLTQTTDPRHLAQRYNRCLAHHAEALRHTDEEVGEFLLVASALDRSEARDILGHLRRSRVRVPVQLGKDQYRIGRYLLSRWNDSAIRQQLLAMVGVISSPALSAAKEGNLQPLLDGEEEYTWPLSTYSVLRQLGRPDLMPAFREGLSPERRDWYQANLAYGRYLIQWYVYDQGRERQLSAGEQREIIRRIHRREVQLQSMRRSYYGIGQERKELTSRLRQTDQAAREELTVLIARLDAIQAEQSAAERDHAAAAAARTEEYCSRVEALEAAIAATQADFAAALAERNQWAPAAMLTGLTLAIIGDDGREAGYRALVESAGGRFIQVSALEKLSRIPEAVATADVVIVMTAIAKHAAEHRLRKAARPGALLLRCPKAGLGALERLLRTEVLPRLALAQAAAAGRPGGESHA